MIGERSGHLFLKVMHLSLFHQLIYNEIPAVIRGAQHWIQLTFICTDNLHLLYLLISFTLKISLNDKKYNILNPLFYVQYCAKFFSHH